MAKKDLHIHVKCPNCGVQTFEILVYPKGPYIKCTNCGEGTEFDDELIEYFKEDIRQGKGETN